MKKKRNILSFIPIALLACYLLWRYSPQGVLCIKESTLQLDVMHMDSASCQHLLVGVQAEMQTYHYRSAEAFYQRLNAHLTPIKEQLLTAEECLIVFPEHIGTWLVVAGERNSIYTSTSITGAMAALIFSHPFSFLKYRFSQIKAAEATQASLFLMKAQSTADIYQNTFNRLAKEYRAHIIAGSVVLPSAKVVGGKIQLSGDTLYNASFTFLPDGSVAQQVTRKVFPVSDEQSFCSAGQVGDINIFASQMGRIGTLICADSWYPESYEHLRSLQADIIAVPSYSTGKGIMSLPWKGYNGFEPPSDIDRTDVGKITEEMAWDKYALSGRIGSAEAAIGVNVFLRGQLWDMQSDGKSKLVISGKDFKTSADGAAVLITCIPNQ